MQQPSLSPQAAYFLLVVVIAGAAVWATSPVLRARARRIRTVLAICGLALLLGSLHSLFTDLTSQ